MTPKLGRVFQRRREFVFKLEGCDPMPANGAGRPFLPDTVEAQWVSTGSGSQWTLSDFHLCGWFLDENGKPGSVPHSEIDHAQLVDGKMTAAYQWLYELLLKFDPGR